MTQQTQEQDKMRAAFEGWRINEIRKAAGRSKAALPDGIVRRTFLSFKAGVGYTGSSQEQARWEAWQAASAQAVPADAKQAVQMPEPVAHLVERHAFRASPDGQDAEGNSWLEECEAGEPGAFTVYTEQQVRAMLAAPDLKRENPPSNEAHVSNATLAGPPAAPVLHSLPWTVLQSLPWKPIREAVFDGRRALVYRPLAHKSNDPNITVARLIGGNHHCWEQTVPEGQEPYNPTDRRCHVTHYCEISEPDGITGAPNAD